MSGMLASVSSLPEAVLVLEGGADIIDLKNPREGVLGALAYPLINEIVTYLNGVKPVSATIGDLPFEAELIEPVIMQTALTGVDIIKVGVFGDINREAELAMLARVGRQGIRIVLVQFAEHYVQNDTRILLESGICGVMLDTMNKHSGSLRDKLSQSVLQDFVSDMHAFGLVSGLAGSLSEMDIPPLLGLKPDYLGFRGGLCRQKNRENVLDKAAIKRVRRAIPRDGMKQKIQSTTIIQETTQESEAWHSGAKRARMNAIQKTK